jgi:hypothetical protein
MEESMTSQDPVPAGELPPGRFLIERKRLLGDLAACPSASSSKPEPPEAQRARDWLEACARPDSGHEWCYRAFAEDADFEEDILTILAHLERIAPAAGHPLDLTYPKLLWRVLMRRYALWQAWKLARFLKRDRWPWRLWRVPMYFLPRLVVAAATGYVALLGSGLTPKLRVIELSPGRLSIWIGVCLAAAWYLGAIDIQRRVGRRGWKLLGRSTLLWLRGIAYSAAILELASCIGLVAPGSAHGPHGLACAAAALALAHVVQLFWHDESIGAPL